MKSGRLVRATGRWSSTSRPEAAARPAACASAAADGTGPLRPRPAAGLFTSLLVTSGITHGLAQHVARLETSATQVFGKGLPATLPGDLAACLAGNPSGRLRITARPAGGPLQAKAEVLPLHQPAAFVRLRPPAIARSLRSHKRLHPPPL